MHRFRLLLLLLCLAALPASAQISYTWKAVRMDSTWADIKDLKATRIIMKYAPLIEFSQEIIAYSDDEYKSKSPESGLSNFTADVIREKAEKIIGGPVDLALVNFGGIRTSMPKGAVRIYDILSIFPFNNDIYVFDIKGSDLQGFFERMVARKIECLSNVRLKVTDGHIDFLQVAGAPIDPERVYKFATINFLFDGGDGIDVKPYATNVVRSGVLIRDAIIESLRAINEEGKTINLQPDGRVKVIKTSK